MFEPSTVAKIKSLLLCKEEEMAIKSSGMLVAIARIIKATVNSDIPKASATFVKKRIAYLPLIASNRTEARSVRRRTANIK